VKRLEAERAEADKSLKAAVQAKQEAEKAATEKQKSCGATSETCDEPSDLKELEMKISDARKRIDELDKSIKETKKKREDFEKAPLPFETAYAVADAKQVADARLQVKGDPKKIGDAVPRRFPKIFGGQALPADETGSGRLALAAWIADSANPLTARVMANRIWQHHFGRGIVLTPSDFGHQGQTPSHPELLDYLARRFVESGWSIKAVHRLVMLSRTYQLASTDDPNNLKVDPNNENLWKFSRRRLDAESIRDAMLAVSGQLDRSVGGPHPFPDQRSWDFTQHKPFKAVYETNRRSVYLMTQRIQRHPYLASFDGPDTNASTAQRVTSTTPLQALYLMNDLFVHDQARHFAARLIAEQPADPGRLDRAHRLALGRSPSPIEVTQCESYLEHIRAKLAAAGVAAADIDRHAWESFARAIFRTSEFVYID